MTDFIPSPSPSPFPSPFASPFPSPFPSPSPSPSPFPSPSPSPFLPFPSPSPSPFVEEDDKPGYYAIIGLLIYIAGTIMMAAGVNLQKYALNKTKEKAEAKGEEPKGEWRHPLWLVGITCYILAGIMLSAALYFATPALVTPFMSVVLISNVVFAHFLLGEPFTKQDGVAIIVVIAGLIITASCAPEDPAKYTSKQLIDLYRNTPFIVFMVLTSVVLLALVGANLWIGKEIKACAGGAPPSEVLKPWKLQLYPFSFASLAGLFGGMTVLIMKSAIEIIVEKIGKGFVPFISSWFMYLLIFLMGFFWSMQMFWLNRGLKFFHAIYIVSLEAVINELVAVTGSIIYFQNYEDESFTTVKKFFFVIGLMVGCVGVLLLAYWRRQMQGEEDQLDLFNRDPQEWMEEPSQAFLESQRGTRKSVMETEGSALMSARNTGRNTGRPDSRELGPSDMDIESYRTDDEATQNAEDLLFSPNPFTPSPMLPYSIWGVPVTPKTRMRMGEQGSSSASFDPVSSDEK